MEAGITGTQTITVTEDKTAQAMGSGTLPVFATPAMIALMENTAYKSVADELEEGAGTVGTLMNVKHVAATPVGMEVTCETKLVEVDRKRLVFADKVNEMCNEKTFEITPNKGEYYLMDKSQGNLVNHVIFQCPNENGKGVRLLQLFMVT